MPTVRLLGTVVLLSENCAASVPVSDKVAAPTLDPTTVTAPTFPAVPQVKAEFESPTAVIAVTGGAAILNKAAMAPPQPKSKRPTMMSRCRTLIEFKRLDSLAHYKRR